MKVKELISKLKKMPQNLEVGMALNDNGPHEVAGYVNAVFEDFDNYDPENPVKYVVLKD